jgi:hypothetical protein
MPALFDAFRLEVADAVAALNYRAASMRAEAIREVERRISGDGYPLLSGTLSAEDAQEHVRRWIAAGEVALQHVVDRRPAAEWLWLLRRATHLFAFNELQTTAPYCERLAEIATSHSCRPRLDRVVTKYPVTSASAVDLHSVRAAVGVLYDLHGTFRWAGKGAPVRFGGSDGPEATPTAQLESAVRTYDQRHSNAPFSPFARAGSGIGIALADPNAFDTPVPIVFPLPERTVIPLPVPMAGGMDGIESGYVLGFLDLGTVRALDGHDQSQLEAFWKLEAFWNPELVATLVALLTCLDPSYVGAGLLNSMSTGYEVCSRRSFAARLDTAHKKLDENPRVAHIPRATRPDTVEGIVSVLAEQAAGLWPPNGGVVLHELGDHLLVDWVGMSRRFLEGMRRVGGDGAIANTWSSAFEDEVQREIDGTTWRPTPEVRRLKGLRLRRGAHDITDIDAVGAAGDRLLMVSCKGLAYTDAYDRGEYGSVRNARTKVEEATKYWQGILARLRSDPIGDNYDVSRYGSLLGMIVIPFFPFLHGDTLERRSFGDVPFVCAISELSVYLGQ